MKTRNLFSLLGIFILGITYTCATSVSSNLLVNEEMQQRLLNMSCTYKCLQYTDIDIGNNETCKCNTSSLDMQILPEKYEIIKLICREAHNIVLKIGTIRDTTEHFIYYVETSRQNDNSWTFFNRFNSSEIIIDNLKENEEYQIRIWLLSQSGNLYEPAITNRIKTKRLSDYPMPVTTIDLLHYEYNDSEYKAIIAWNASEDKCCHHEFVWFGADDVSDYTQMEVEVPFDFTITIGKLKFNTNYSVAVMTKSSDWELESEKVWFHFSTPRCLEVLNSLEFCVPDMPTGIQTQEELIFPYEDEHVYNINITWEQPGILPEYYIVHLNSFDSENKEGNSLNISGASTNVCFNNIPLSLHYQVTIFAYSKAGRSDPGEYYKQINPKNFFSTLSNLNVDHNIFLYFVLPLLVIVSVTSFCIFGYKKFNQRQQTAKRQQHFEEFELKPFYLESPLPDDNTSEKADEWEIDINCLTLQSTLGRGAFGIVRKGWLYKKNTKVPVAVKMLLDDHRYTDMRDFKQEIEIMKSVGSHPHIVSLIGCCTKGKPDDLRLIVEYCSRGDLLTYLRTAWDQITNQCNDHQYTNVENKDLSNVDNKLYLLELEVTDSCNLQMKDLISIGLQVAMGMEYLSSLHVLHRDLAARNVLVCENNTVKVSDFGLSRDVYKDNVYCKTSSGKLPVRWLALESLTHQIYTTQSDVWSYGILLWEIITLGGNPYPGVQTQELLDLLTKGYRMNCPANCSQELYSIMMSCWNTNPKDRPTFRDIRKLLDDILGHTSGYLNLNLFNSLDDDVKKGNSITTSLSSERYVKAFAQ